MTSEQQREALARCEAATPGPWENGGPATISLSFDAECNVFPPDTMKTHGFQFGGPVAVVNYRGECDSNPDGADAEFIAHARTDLPAALKHIEAQDKRIAELEAELLKLADACMKVAE